MTAAVAGTPPAAVVLDWPVGTGTGWGTFGLNLALQLTRDERCQVALLMPAAELHPLHQFLLRPALLHQAELQRALEQTPDAVVDCDYPVLRALGNNFVTHDTSRRLRSDRNIGLIFFEDTCLHPEGLERAKQFDTIVAGSHWNGEVLRAAGLEDVVTIQQGIDPTVFHPGPRSGCFGDRFVVFSGGKLEYRKGQDLVVAAFRAFHRRHPDALLVTAWHNPWPQTMVGLDSTGHVRGLPAVDRHGRLCLGAWLESNGLPAGSYVDLGPLHNYLMGPTVREADVALFPNRCEGGTNLVAMEAMAAGVPVILSANTGHLDLIQPGTCYPLERQRPVGGECPLYAGYEGWGESDVEEIVERLEHVYEQRVQARETGIRGARQMHKAWTWERQAARLLEVLAA